MILTDVNVLVHAYSEASTDHAGQLVADAYHAALAIESGSEWLTTDRGSARFPGLRWRHPLR